MSTVASRFQDVRDLATVLAVAHKNLDAAGTPPAPPHHPWAAWRYSHRRLDARQERQLARRYQAGEPARDLAEHYGISLATTHRTINRIKESTQ